MNIAASVGNKGKNRVTDVKLVQRLINKRILSLCPLHMLTVDGNCGPITIGMIKEFQRRVVGLSRPDGRVDPSGKTLTALNKPDELVESKPYDSLLHLVQSILKLSNNIEKPFVLGSQSKTLSESDFSKAANLLGAEVAAIKAVSSVESAGGGFYKNGNPKILFEGHWFSKLTKGAHDAKNPTISYKKWTKKHYKGGIEEYTRYNAAKALNKEAAMKSTSWGKFQIMGFNHKKCGYANVTDFVTDMYKSEGHQLNAFVKFLKATNLDAHLKAKSWASFAKGYNGSGYAENKYDIRLKQAYKAFSTK